MVKRFVQLNEGERFDTIEINTVERWKESELSGDEWRYSYIVSYYSHGELMSRSGGFSVKDALINASHVYDTLKTFDNKFTADITEFCCQPGCPNPWTQLKHPIRRYTRQGEELARPYGEEDVRGFCEKHSTRGDCGLDDNDDNYILVESRFPPDWTDDNKTEGDSLG